MKFIVLLMSTGLIGCPDPDKFCNENPTNSQCIHPAEPNLFFTYSDRKMDGEAFFPVQCGGFVWVVNWSSEGALGAPEDGFLVQKVHLTVTNSHPSNEAGLNMCVGGEPLDETYWEIWEWNAGDRQPAPHSTDSLGISSQNVAQGTARIMTEASFYPYHEVEAEYGNFLNGATNSPYTGVLPSVREMPTFWATHPKEKLMRDIKVSWDCCAPQETVFVCGTLGNACP